MRDPGLGSGSSLEGLQAAHSRLTQIQTAAAREREIPAQLNHLRDEAARLDKALAEHTDRIAPALFDSPGPAGGETQPEAGTGIGQALAGVIDVIRSARVRLEHLTDTCQL